MPFSGLTLKEGTRGDAVTRLHVALFQLGYASHIARDEIDNVTFGPGTTKAVVAFQRDNAIPVTGIVDTATAALIDDRIAALGASQRTIEGRVRFEYGAPATDLPLRLYARSFGCDGTRLSEAITDAKGGYTFSYSLDGGKAGLEIRAVDGKGTEVSLSTPWYDAGEREVMHLVAPAALRPLATEHARLMADVEQQIKDPAALAKARETGECRDLTLLHRITGWDARLIALGAIAERQSAATGIDADVLYALFRSGLSTDPQRLALVGVDTVQEALARAAAAGIAEFDEQKIAAAGQAFDKFARIARRDIKAPGALSSAKDLLDLSQLSPEDQARFEDVYFTRRDGVAGDLWDRARQSGIAETQIAQLKTLGTLAYLTFDNAVLTRALRGELKEPGAISRLADLDLGVAGTWKDRIRALAPDEPSMAEMIPPAYAGSSVEARLDAYAADLARKVRVSFPTRVVARLLERGEISLNGAQDVSDAQVVEFLRRAEGLGFELGQVPVDAFAGTHRDALFAGQSAEQIKGTTSRVKQLQRLYQITPSNEALVRASRLGFTSAFDVTAFSPEAFVERYADQFSSRAEAELIYGKAEQVAAVTREVLTIVRQMDSTPPIYALSPLPEPPAGSPGSDDTALSDRARRDVRAVDGGAPPDVSLVRQHLIRRFPTLETLIGSTDFCECDGCRSVLSPAAYFVDLLKFLDPPDRSPEWESFLAEWARRHQGRTYSDAGYEKPYTALTSRRPDLPHLLLTCENTNTLVPHIDLVNEILEYWVAHARLSAETARDTDGAISSDLVAEPQHVIPAAYDALAEARYPLALPFDLWLETVRRFLDAAGTPLADVLDKLRTTDDLFGPGTGTDQPPAADETSYFRAAIFAESLGFSPEEYAVMTSRDPRDTWYGLYGYESADAALDALTSAKTLARRLGVTYQELVDLVRSSFVNPRLEPLAPLQRNHIDVAHVASYLGMPGYTPFTPDERDAFIRRLASLGLTDWLDAVARSRAFDGILLLAAPATGCDFGQTTLRYLNLTDAAARERLPLDLRKLNLFVRLWRKLGCSIDETDRVLRTFVPANAREITASNIGPALSTVLLCAAHAATLDTRLGVFGPDSRQRLLTLWSDVPTTGPDPLYARLFLKPGGPGSDPVFDDRAGRYLEYFDRASGTYRPFRWDPAQPEDPATGNVSLAAHLPAIEEALNLTAEDADRILSDAAGRPLAEAGEVRRSAALTVATISLLHRYALLARALRLRVRDLITLKNLSAADPFQPLSPDPIRTVADDRPLAHTLRFLNVAEQIRKTGMPVEDIDHILRHQFDPAGRHRADPAAAPALTSALAAELRRIRTEHPIPSESAGAADASEAVVLSDDAIRQALAIVLPPEAVDQFLAMWAGTVDYRAEETAVAPEDRLNDAAFVGHPAVRTGYDRVRRVQWLVYRGMLPSEERMALLSLDPGTRPLLERLLDSVQRQATEARESLRRHFVRESAPLEGLLAPASFELLFAPPAPIPEDLPELDKQERRRSNDLQLRNKRRLLARALMPVVQRQLTRDLIVRTLSTASSSDPALVEALVTDDRLLADPASVDMGGAGRRAPLLEAFSGAAENGVTAMFYMTPDRPPLDTRTIATIDSASTAASARPAGAASARFTGFLEVPATGAYRFTARLDRSGAEVELRFDDRIDPLVLGRAARDGDEIGGFLDLRTGVPYGFTLDARLLGDGGVTLLVESERLPQDNVARLTLHPSAVVERIARGRMSLDKALRVIQVLGLTVRELRHIRAHPGDFDGFDLALFPTRVPGDPDAGRLLFMQFLRVAGYASLKTDLAGGSEGLIDIFERARRNYPAAIGSADAQRRFTSELFSRVGALMRVDATTIEAVARALGFVPAATRDGDLLRFEIPALADERGLRKLWDVVQVVGRVGAPIDAIRRWTGIVGSGRSATSRARRFDIARAVRGAAQARSGPERWRQVAQPIFEALRRRQRDALVARVMDQHPEGFERADELFEYFLVDPAVEPVVQTSRLRLAISSVQLFVQRCLLNLELKVPPSVIDARQWEWMKRYRVWEANRKIFLYPENYLEPELRMERSHLFGALEGALLQGEVSQEAAEDAFSKYLSGLEGIARLEIVTVCGDEDAEPQDAGILHVIGRTYNQPRQYFYRRRTHARWTPWEPVSVDIDGDHVTAVVWRGRLHILWCTFLEHAVAPAGSPRELADTSVSDALQRQVEIQVSWAEYFQGVWTAHTSGGFGGASIHANVPTTFDRRSVAIHISKEMDGEREGALRVHLSGPFREFIWLGGGTPPAAAGGSGLLLRPTVWSLPVAKAFRIRGRNAAPQPIAGELLQPLPYANTTAETSVFRGDGALSVALPGSEDPSGRGVNILARGVNFTLAFDSTPPRTATADTAAHGTFFYQDDRHAFFVEPTWADVPVMRWDDWGMGGGVLRYLSSLEQAVLTAPIAAQVPVLASSLPDDPVGPYARYRLRAGDDWIATGGPSVSFDQGLVARGGLAPDEQTLPAGVR